jgi:ribosomal protein L11 methyltransferase
MPWLQLTLETQAELSEELESALLALGAVSITLTDNADQPLFEPPPGATPLWNAIRLSALFPADTQVDDLLRKLHSRCAHPLPQARAEILEDKDWEREWMDKYEPMPFGKRLWVCPSWKDIPDPTAINLLLDPGLAFGTGTHPTTALCLRRLDAIELHDKTVIDFGCGSGILAIAAALLGARQAIGIDNDPQALIATRNNAERNHVADRVIPFLPEQAPVLSGDVVIANILAGTLINLSDVISSRVKPDGLLSLSGILEGQEAEVIQAYESGFQILGVIQEEDWIRIDAIKNS